jgi:hypothetical protein
MALTLQQLAALKADILADPAMAEKPNTTAGNSEIAAMYAADASPAFYVWKTFVLVDEIMNNGFDWTRVDNATVGKARIWEWMTRQGYINPSKANVRAGINEAWAGTGAEQVAHRAGIFAHLHRPANRLEKLFATGTGSLAVPAVMGYEGTISSDEIETARAS